MYSAYMYSEKCKLSPGQKALRVKTKKRDQVHAKRPSGISIVIVLRAVCLPEDGGLVDGNTSYERNAFPKSECPVELLSSPEAIERYFGEYSEGN